MAKKSKRKVIGLVCKECGQRHYYTTKNAQNQPDKLEFRKYCPKIKKYTKHIETSKNLGKNVVKAKK